MQYKMLILLVKYSLCATYINYVFYLLSIDESQAFIGKKSSVYHLMNI